MPRDFPDMQSLTRSAENHGYRPPSEGESEPAYRAALADFVNNRQLKQTASDASLAATGVLLASRPIPGPMKLALRRMT